MTRSGRLQKHSQRARRSSGERAGGGRLPPLAASRADATLCRIPALPPQTVGVAGGLEPAWTLDARRAQHQDVAKGITRRPERCAPTAMIRWAGQRRDGCHAIGIAAGCGPSAAALHGPR